MRPTKYHAKKAGAYASRREGKRAQELRLLALAGEISELREQVKFELIPRQMDGKRVAERNVCYVADFVYRDKEGHLVVEDSKGFRTREYIIKRKLMRYIHNIAIKET